MRAIRSGPCEGPVTPLAEAMGGERSGLGLGFRGYAAVYQPDVAAFLARSGAHLTGLSPIADPDDLIARIRAARPDYLVLAPGPDATELLDRIAGQAPSAPVVVLAAGGSPDRLAGGANTQAEAVPPTATPLDVALILRALMRRARPQALVGQSNWQDLSLDEACLSFGIRGAQVSLSLEIFCVLGAMMDDPGRVWPRRDLHRLVFGAASTTDIRALDMRISRTRRHVVAALGADPIRSVRGVGYTLVGRPKA